MRNDDGRASGGLPRGTWAMFGLLSLLVAVPVVRADEGRDSDGSRLGAEPQALGTEQEDSLDPPDDESDWRYVKLEGDRELEITLEGEPESGTAVLRLTTATGDELKRTEHSGGTTRLQRELSPGIYYIEVTGDSAFEYTHAVE